MPNRILSIAANTFRETIRNKVLYVILAFALLVISLSWFLADLSVGDLARIIADVGLASIQIFGVIMAVFIGITLISQEVDKKTIYLILSRPVPRWEFIVGKALGLSLTLALTTLVMTVTLFFLHLGYGRQPEAGIFIAAAGIYMELIALTCLASFFSTFTTPVLSAIFTLSMFFIGHISGDLLVFGARAQSKTLQVCSRFLYYVLPNLELFNWKNDVVYGTVRSAGRIWAAAGYLVCYFTGVLFVACLLFSRKDLK